MAQNNPMAVPGDYAIAQEERDRRRKLYQAMEAQSLAGLPAGRQVGAHFVGTTPLEGVAKLVQAYMGQKGTKGMDGEDTKAAGEFRDQLKGAVMEYANNPDRRTANYEGIASQFPQVQALAQAAMEAQSKGAITPKDLTGLQDPNKMGDLIAQGVHGFAPKKDFKVVDGVAIDANTMDVLKANGPQPAREMINGDLYERNPTTERLKKLDNAPRVTVGVTNNPVFAGQKAGMSEYFKRASQQVDKLGQAADNSQQLMGILDTLEGLHKAGINSNITSDMATAAQNLGQALGVKVDTNKLGNTEAYNSLIVDLWQKAVSQNGGNRGVTAEEAQEIKKLTPMARYSPEAREQLFGIQRQIAQRNIVRYQNANESFAKAAAADDPSLFKIPDDISGAYIPSGIPGGQPGQSNTAPMSLDEYWQKVNGGK